MYSLEIENDYDLKTLEWIMVWYISDNQLIPLEPLLQISRFAESYIDQNIEYISFRILELEKNWLQDLDLEVQEEYDELIREFDKNEDFTEDELNKQIALLGKTTKRFFEEEKKAVKSQRDDYTKKVIEKQESFKNSGLVSVENLSKAYPDFSKTELNKVRSILVEGKLENLIYDSSGMYRDDVAERVAFMLYGKQIMENAEKKGVRKGESQKALEIVDKSPKKIKQSGQVHTDKKLDLSAVAHLGGAFKKSVY